MTCRRDLWRLAPFSPQHWARSGNLGFRVARFAIVFCLLWGQTGLPDLAALCGRGSSAELASAEATSGCRCSTALKRRGRCCCAMPKSSPPVKRCCAKRPGKAAETATCKIDLQAAAAKHRPSTASLSYRDACGCGAGDEGHGYRCTEPRVMPPSLQLTEFSAPSFSALPANDRSVGDALPPPSPPPRSLAV